VVDLFKKTLLQAVIVQFLRQGKEAVGILDEMAGNKISKSL
jgi:hypothetical protein